MNFAPLTEAGLADHLFALVFVVAYPIAGIFGFRRLLRRIAAGQPVDRLHVYRNTMIGHWTLLVMASLLWWTAGRPWSGLGLYWSSDPAWAIGVAGAFVVLAILVLLRQLREVGLTDGLTASRLHDRLGSLEAVVPRTAPELRRFYAVSFTAGVVEEVLWRGYLIWYLSQFWSLGIAALASTLAFGVAHGYQGWRQVPSIIAVGAALAGLYLLTGTLWASIALHIAIDVLQGRLGYEITRGRAAH
jgi:membrane protease YdiL (CAAX protease family)